MKEKELREHTKCDVCSKPIGFSGLPAFWTLHAKRHGIKMNEVIKQDALASFIGSTRIAAVMGPDAEMTETLLDVEITVCESCMYPLEIDSSQNVTVAIMLKAEAQGKKEDT